MTARGEHWNRAGRRSGGARLNPIEIPTSAVRYTCPACGNDTLPLFVTSGCLTCRTIVEGHLRAERHEAALRGPDPPPSP